MKCPVCRTECDNIEICPKCGFSELGKVFINKEEAEQWYNTTVIPFRDNYCKSNILPAIEWLDIFKQDPQVKHLFDFSIPVAIKRRIDLDSSKNPMDDEYNTFLMDATLGHVAIVSSSDMIRKHFVEELNKAYLSTVDFKRVVSNCVERASDLAAILTSMAPGGAFLFEINSKMKKDVVKLFSTALSEFHFEITIGKGPGARSVGLDLPAFTTIFVAESLNDLPDEITNSLDAIIEFNPEQNELDELQIREIAPLYNIQLTKVSIELIKECASQKAFKNIKSILKFISDYIYLHPEFKQPLGENEIRDIIKNVSSL